MLHSHRSRQLCARPLNAVKNATKLPPGAKIKKRSNAQQGSQAAEGAAAAGALKGQYLASAAAASAIGIVCTVAPHRVMQVLGSHDIVDVTERSAQVYGCYGILVAAAAYRLAQAASPERSLLASPTYIQLNLFLSLFCGASATCLLTGIATSDLAAAPAGAAALVLFAAAGTPFAQGYLAAGSGSTDLAEVAAGFGNGLKQTFKAGRGFSGVFYSLSFWETFILGVALLFGPILPTIATDISGSTIIVKDLVGAGTVLYAGITWLLLDACDRDRLGASTFRALNAAAGAVALLVGSVCLAGQLGGASNNLTNQAVVLVSSGLIALVYLYLAVKPPTNKV